MATMPSGLRRVVSDAQSLAGKNLEDVALAAGAAIGHAPVAVSATALHPASRIGRVVDNHAATIPGGCHVPSPTGRTEGASVFGQ